MRRFCPKTWESNGALSQNGLTFGQDSNRYLSQNRLLDLLEMLDVSGVKNYCHQRKYILYFAELDVFAIFAAELKIIV